MNILRLRSLFFASSEIGCNCLIKLHLFRSELIGHRLCCSLLIQRLTAPILHILLEASDEEFVDAIVAHFANPLGGNIGCGKNIFVQKLKKFAKCIGTSPVRCGREQEQVLALLGQPLGSLITLRLIHPAAIVVCRELVAFVEHYQIPVRIGCHIDHIFPTEKINGSNHMVSRLKHIRVGGKKTPVHQCKRQVELHLQFILLPLLRQSARCNDEYPVYHSSHNQLLDEQTRHDGFSSTGVIREEKANFRLG